MKPTHVWLDAHYGTISKASVGYRWVLHEPRYTVRGRRLIGDVMWRGWRPTYTGAHKALVASMKRRKSSQRTRVHHPPIRPSQTRLRQHEPDVGTRPSSPF